MNALDHHRVTVRTAALTAILAMLSLVWWLGYDPTAAFTTHIPGMDNRPAGLESSGDGESVRIGEIFDSFDGKPAQLPGSWPRFRGLDLDNISKNNLSLAERWESGMPSPLWRVSLGEGHAAPVVSEGRVYLLDYDEARKADALRCFSLEDGREIWRRSYRVKIKRNHGLSRTIPAVTSRFVVTIGPRCHVMCCDARSGDFLWGLDLEKEFGTETPFWYTGQCPLIDDSIAVIAPAGEALMIGVDCATGAVRWKTPNPNRWQMSHSSIMPMRIAGKKMYVYCAVGGMVAVSAEGEDAGAILWENSDFDATVIAPSPILLDNGRIFMTAGYGAGAIMLQVREDHGVFTVEKLLEYPSSEGPASEQQTPVYFNGRLYCIQPKDAGILRNQLVCYDPDNLSAPLWASGKTTRFGLGPFLFADGKIFVLSDDGVLTLLDATAKQYRELAQARVLEGHDAWGPMALAGTRLLLRDSREMVCLEVGPR
ncbi:MAG TPA: PQQ-binding-like beta-propeller repeat protein [Calditrichia bacterium]|nr:PQQ-binding-like beta-propeller repeat protein [Calditrichota bacterium]HQU73393.1 PQQ-binding-like beta-propeller repeat protein [Calditrichia bacterium]HQV31138.1 PQQ-binding-like beta-propeller repeat protein [Calditrichia bacterium]